MSLFDNMLKDDESLFKNEEALDNEFLPKLLPYRENQQKYAAGCIQPLLQGRNGKNLFIFGAPGIGKTAAIRWIFRDLEEYSEEVISLYINCWQLNTTYKIYVALCHQLGYHFTQNKKTEELFDVIKKIVNKGAAAFCFDEIDKAEDFDFLYSVLEGVYKRSVFLITNDKEWYARVEQRLKSRLLPEFLEFREYNPEETRGIVRQRIDYAFVPGVWEKDAFGIVAEKTAEMKDIRVGLHLLRQSGMIAEGKGSRKITAEHAKEAVSKLDDFSIGRSDELDDDTKQILLLVREHSSQKIGELFRVYQEKGGKDSYKTFQRRIEKLSKGRFITTERVTGKDGNTTIVSCEKEKKITDF